jgi:hypothetical protein
MAEQQLKIRLDAVDNTQRAFKGLQSNLNSTRASLLNFKNLLIGLGIGTLINEVVKTNASFQDLRTTLKFVTGSAESGNNAFKLLQNLAIKSKFNVDQLTDTFVALYSSGINPTEELLQTFINTASIFGNEVDTLNDLTKLFAKGTQGGLGLQAINNLAGKGIPVFDILEKKLGVTRDTLAKFAEGAGNSEKILKALQEGLSETFTGASEANINNLSIAMSSLYKEFQKSLEAIGVQGGFNQGLLELIKNIKVLLVTLEPLAVGLGKLFEFITGSLTGAIQFLNMILKEWVMMYNELIDLVKLNPTLKIEINRGQLEQGAIAPPKINPPDLNFLEQLLKKFQEITLVAKSLAQTIAEGMVRAIDNFSKGIAESIVLGKSLQGTLKAVAQTILIEIISAQVKEIAILLSKLAIEKAILAYKMAQASASGGGLFSTLAKIGLSAFGGGSGISGQSPDLSAEGGAINAGNPYVVGERGRELFIPSTNGTMIPNHDLGGGTNITFNIQANDVRGIKELLIDNRATIINLVNQGANAKGRSNVV